MQPRPDRLEMRRQPTPVPLAGSQEDVVIGLRQVGDFFDVVHRERLEVEQPATKDVEVLERLVTERARQVLEHALANHEIERRARSIVDDARFDVPVPRAGHRRDVDAAVDGAWDLALDGLAIETGPGAHVEHGLDGDTPVRGQTGDPPDEVSDLGRPMHPRLEPLVVAVEVRFVEALDGDALGGLHPPGGACRLFVRGQRERVVSRRRGACSCSLRRPA